MDHASTSKLLHLKRNLKYINSKIGNIGKEKKVEYREVLEWIRREMAPLVAIFNPGKIKRSNQWDDPSAGVCFSAGINEN